MSTRRLKLAENSRKAAQARSQKLMEMSKRQVRDSQKNLNVSGKSLDGQPTSGRSLNLSEANVESGMVL